MASSNSGAASTTERSYYDGDVDFDVLAEQDADFAAICRVSKDERWIDFQNPKVVQQLTKSLLKCDFGVSIQLPDDRLCPPVPVRWNYVHWIQELLDTTSDTYSDRYDPEREVIGLDIGVGASCIYPLLACSSRSSWRMAGTDIDQHSLSYARKNVDANGTSKRIKLAHTTTDSPLIPIDALKIEELDFLMTNPPFYSSTEDMQASYTAKTAPPSAVCTGAENEMICPGGDVGFVTRILTESLELRDRVQWYTAMFGKISSLQIVVAKLKEHDITNFAVTCLQAGYRTKRWAVGWSFGDYRPRNDVARHGELVQAVLPSPTAQTISVPLMDSKWAGEKVDEVIGELAVKWRWRANLSTGLMEARENVWSRSARRKRKFAEEGGKGPSNDVTMGGGDGEGSEDEDDDDIALAVKIVCKSEVVELRWLRGSDYVLFTSFCGFLKRALTSKA
ncbi:hypothetical protein LTR08_004963 [Meristemomyces frigidus]|nr:hypothetical protein LTR08_004963 [Meristemomyces frigidus]